MVTIPLLALFALAALYVAHKIVRYLSTPHLNSHLQPKITSSPHQRILITSLSTGNWIGGQELHSFILYKMLNQQGHHATMLVTPSMQLCSLLKQYNLSFYTLPNLVARCRIRPIYHFFVRRCMKRICIAEDIDIIHCNNRYEVKDASWVATKLQVKTVFTRHVPEPFRLQAMRGLNAAIGVSQFITNYLEQENHTQDLGIKKIAFIPPFFDAEKFTSFVPQETRQEFFNQQFGIAVDQNPIICTIANFYGNTLQHKNHPLLLHAIHKLVHQKNRPVNVMLAGNSDQETKTYFAELAKKLGIEPYIHFLGFTTQTPALLYHSDIMVLPSRHEGFGVCYLEAGLVKRPAIGATQTGAEGIILHEKTGLLFKNNDVDDLANAIERLLSDSAWSQQLGRNAYGHIMDNFSPTASLARHLELYGELS